MSTALLGRQVPVSTNENSKEQSWGVFVRSSEPRLGLTLDLPVSSITRSCCNIYTYFGFCLEEGNIPSTKELLSNAFIFYGGSPLSTAVPHLQGESRFFAYSMSLKNKYLKNK